MITQNTNIPQMIVILTPRDAALNVSTILFNLPCSRIYPYPYVDKVG